MNDWRSSSARAALVTLVPVLMTLAACSVDSTGPSTGNVLLTTSTTGSDIDPDGYRLSWDGGTEQPIAVNGALPLNDAAAGSHVALLNDLADNCAVDGENPRTVMAQAGKTTASTFAVTCVERVGDLRATTATSGTNVDPDGYLVVVDDVVSEAIGVSDSVVFSALDEGDHIVELTGLALNCSVVGINPRTVTVAFGETIETAFAITCTEQLGDLTVMSATTGVDLDPDGYSAIVDGALMQNLGVNDTVPFSNLVVGDHSVQLSGLDSNCSVSGGNPRTVTVPLTNAETTFAVVCSSLTGNLTATTATTGVDIDPDGYTVEVDGTQTQSIGVNDTVTFAGLPVGDHTVELKGVAANCVLSGNNPRTVTVPSGDTVQTDIAVICVPLLGDLTVISETSGNDIDPDGYTVTVDGVSQALGVNDAVTFINLPVGDYSVELSGVVANCSVSGDNPRTITVPYGGTSTTFTVTCVFATGDLRINTVTGGSGTPDPDGYTVTLDGTTSQSIGNNSTTTFGGLSPGDHTVELTGLADNCDVDGGANPRTVSVPGGNTAVTTFNVNCLQPLISGKIVFESNRTGNFDLWAMDPDGSGLLNLTNTPGSDERHPHVSPDGLRIAFWGDRDGSNDIFVMGTDGSGVTNLTGGSASNFWPVWSPDGSSIAWSRRSGGQTDVWVMNADGSSRRNITNEPTADDDSPSWSPDGSQIAFVSNRGGNVDLYIMSSDGSGSATRLTTDPGDDFAPAWHPSDAATIMFTTDRASNGLKGEIYLIDVNTLVETNLTNDPDSDFESDWSPDGSKIALTSLRDGNAEIYTMDPDGSNQIRITSSGNEDGQAAWSP